MALVRFTFDDDDELAIDQPPADALERASWLHLVLCRMLHDIMTDESLTEAERRDAAAVLATKITQATPNHEIHQARKAIADDERKTEKKEPLTGAIVDSANTETVTSAETRYTSHIRANAPRGRETKD